MLSSPLFRAGDIVTAGRSPVTSYVISDVDDSRCRDLYLLSEIPYVMCRFDYRTFHEGNRIYNYLCDTYGVR